MSVTIEEYQRFELKILHAFKEVCDEHGLRWWAMFGSLLGAARHKGFIPWDDDIDVVMPPEDYLRFREVMSRQPPEGYYVECHAKSVGSMIPWQVMGVTQSMSLPRRYADAPAAWGVCMDIFPLINCPSPEDLQGMKAIAKQIRRSRALVDKYDYRYEGRRTGGVRGLYLKLMGGYPNALNERLWRRMERRMLEGKAYEGSGYKAVFDIPNDFMPLPAECFSETTYLPFEDLIVPVPVGYEQLLDLLYACYGVDWRIIPEHGYDPRHSGGGNDEVMVSLTESYVDHMEL